MRVRVAPNTVALGRLPATERDDHNRNNHNENNHNESVHIAADPAFAGHAIVPNLGG